MQPADNAGRTVRLQLIWAAAPSCPRVWLQGLVWFFGGKGSFRAFMVLPRGWVRSFLLPVVGNMEVRPGSP